MPTLFANSLSDPVAPAMFPPSQSLLLNFEAISGIAGSVSIACWVVVFSPQIIENFRRSSAEGLSISFLVIWLAGDIFNVLGAVLQGVLPTMVILAVYYTLADIVLLIQCLYYRHTASSEPAPLLAPPAEETAVATPGEQSPLLSSTSRERHYSILSITDIAHHLSPATPLVNGRRKSDSSQGSAEAGAGAAIASLRAQQQQQSQTRNGRRSVWRAVLFNTVAVLTVVLSGVFGWFISNHDIYGNPRHDKHGGGHHHVERKPLEWSNTGQAFGYLCAVFYLASRLPQILLNYQRKSCEGVSLLFFLFACLGNSTYVISILAYEPGDDPEDTYLRYLGVNASWILGSFGTLVLDFAIFVQFFMYSQDDDDDEAVESDDEGTVRPNGVH